MVQRSRFFPIKVLFSYLIIAALIVGVGYILYKENKLFSSIENQTANENQRLIRLSNLISKIYDVDNLGKIAIQSNNQNDFILYKNESDSLRNRIESFRSEVTNVKQVVLLDSLKQILAQKIANIKELQKINSDKNDYVPIEKAVRDLTKIEESMGKITLEGLKIDSDKLSAYEKKVYQDYVDYLNKNVPKDETNSLTDHEVDSILVASKKTLEKVRLDTENKSITQKAKEISLLKNDLFISQKLNQILNTFEADVLTKANENAEIRKDTQQKTVSILTIASIVGLITAGLFFVLITNDFLKNQRYRNQLEAEKKKTESLLSSREQLIATVSHDLKTPLNTFQGFSELIGNAQISEKQKYYLDNIKSSSVYINQLVNDLLDFSKIEAGKVALEITKFSMHNLIEEVANSFLSIHREKAVELQLDIDSIKGFLFETDELRLRQILSNLIGNAFKFTNKGFVNVSANYDGKNLSITVADSGIGIKAEKLDLIFNEFTQADESIEKQYGGTGLGLTICQKLASILGGKITVASEYKKGSQFAFKMPVNGFKELPKTSIPNQLKPLKIAVLDDDIALLQLTTEFLKLHRFEVLSFSKPETLLSQPNLTDFDVILTDIQMPNISGFDLLKSIPNAIPVVAITGNRTLNRSEYIEKGFAEIIYKPYSSEQLLQVLSDLFQIKIESKSGKSEQNQVLTGKNYDLSKMKTMLSSDENAIKEVLSIFDKNTKSSFVEIKNAIENKDIDTVAAVSHRLIPMMNQIDAAEIVLELQQLESAIVLKLDWQEIEIIYENTKVKSLDILQSIEKEI
jgi:signal transduction histidine kinase/FixJ family two-component response regulator